MSKYYDKSKNGLFALGYIKNANNLINELSRITDEEADLVTLNNRVTEAYENGNALCYQYVDGNPVDLPFDEKKTYLYCIGTGYYSKSINPAYPGEEIYACFSRGYENTWVGVKFATRYRIENHLNSYRLGYIDFRTYADANTFIVQLESNLLPGETWSFKESSAQTLRPKTEFEILQSYLQHVFDKLVTEYRDPHSKNYNKIVFSQDGKYALFNSGLLDKYARDVYLLGEVYNMRPDHTFTFSNPQIAPGMVELMRNYGFNSYDLRPFPDVVEFFQNLDEIVYDSNIEIDLSPEKMHHIIVDGATRGRFPKKYTEMFNQGDYSSLANTLEAAITNSKKIAKRNYKFVVPQYRSAKNGMPGKIQFLMPIYLDRQYGQKPDFALVLNEERVGTERFYIPETILELAWAYNNARVLCKPEDTWLNPSMIETPESSPADEED